MIQAARNHAPSGHQRAVKAVQLIRAARQANPTAGPMTLRYVGDAGDHRIVTRDGLVVSDTREARQTAEARRAIARAKLAVLRAKAAR